MKVQNDQISWSISTSAAFFHLFPVFWAILCHTHLAPWDFRCQSKTHCHRRALAVPSCLLRGVWRVCSNGIVWKLGAYTYIYIIIYIYYTILYIPLNPPVHHHFPHEHHHRLGYTKHFQTHSHGFNGFNGWLLYVQRFITASPSPVATFPLPCSAGPMGTPRMTRGHAALRKLSKQHAQWLENLPWLRMRSQSYHVNPFNDNMVLNWILIGTSPLIQQPFGLWIQGW